MALPATDAVESCLRESSLGLASTCGSVSALGLSSTNGLLSAAVVVPNGTEGYRTAEVTMGGVDTDHISSKTMEAKAVPGLYFIGEVLDVTGWLGGYNFQWAWSSAFACAEHILSNEKTK